MYSLMHAVFMQRLSLILASAEVVAFVAHSPVGWHRPVRGRSGRTCSSGGDFLAPVVGWRDNGGATTSQRRGHSWPVRESCNVLFI